MARQLLVAAALLVPALASAGAGNPAQIAILDQYVAVAKAEPGYSGPSPERGRAFFFASHAAGKADTPACTSCHSEDLKGPGRTRAGKAIEPMAASVAPGRYADAATVEKWLKRNCADVLGRECTASEKADALAFLLGL
jgi:hypothetical protein